jgi:hypothetical protein
VLRKRLLVLGLLCSGVLLSQDVEQVIKEKPFECGPLDASAISWSPAATLVPSIILDFSDSNE